MTPQQSRMARAGLKWSLDDLATEAGVGRATVARFENGGNVEPERIQAMRAAFERRRVKFIETGKLAGAVWMGLRPG